MEKPKFTLKIERYNPQSAFAWIAFACFLMSLFTIYQYSNILPDPRFFYFGQLIIASVLFCGLLVLIVRWLSGLDWRFSLGLLLGLLVFCAVLIPFTIFMSWAFGTIYFSFLRYIPAIIFPILFVIFLVLAFASKSLGDRFHPRAMKVAAALSLLFCIIYLWGQSAIFEGAYYDEGLSVGGKDYQSIVYYGLMGDPGFIQLYQCQWAIFACEKIYESPYEPFNADKTELLYEESTKTLRLQYRIAGQEPRLLFEYTVP